MYKQLQLKHYHSQARYVCLQTQSICQLRYTIWVKYLFVEQGFVCDFDPFKLRYRVLCHGTRVITLFY